MVQIQKGLEGKREAVLPGSALLQAEDPKTQITKYKYRHKKQQECFNFSKKHISPHFVANLFIKKSVKADNSSLCDT